MRVYTVLRCFLGKPMPLERGRQVKAPYRARYHTRGSAARGLGYKRWDSGRAGGSPVGATVGLSRLLP